MAKTEADKSKTFKCTIEGCSAEFKKNSKLTIHLRRHNNERPYVCNFENCEKSYTCSSHLLRHKKLSHEPKDPSEQYACEYEGCDMILANKYSYKKHCNRKHLRKFPFQCTECSEGFLRKKQLQQHTYVHTNEPFFKCDKCTKGFVSFSDYNKHQRSHKTYTCECGEVFHKWTQILEHKRTHHRPKFRCETCDRVFTQKSNLNSHKKIHEDDRKTFACPYKNCQRSYLFNRNLQHHIRIFHGTVARKLLSCTYPGCKQILKNNRTLKHHYQIHFKWKNKNKTRKTRHDKGKSKICMAAVLSGLDVPKDIQADIINNSTTDDW